MMAAAQRTTRTKICTEIYGLVRYSKKKNDYKYEYNYIFFLIENII